MTSKKRLFFLLLALLVVFIPVGLLPAEETAEDRQGGEADLAQELTNPLADLMTIPIQMNWDRNIGVEDDGRKMQTNIQPVVPFHLSEDWNLISRTIAPLIHQKDIFPGAGSQFGLGDINLSLFFSPRKPTSGGMIWGAGPIFLLEGQKDESIFQGIVKGKCQREWYR